MSSSFIQNNDFCFSVHLKDRIFQSFFFKYLYCENSFIEINSHTMKVTLLEYTNQNFSYMQSSPLYNSEYSHHSKKKAALNFQSLQPHTPKSGNHKSDFCLYKFSNSRSFKQSNIYSMCLLC